MHDQLRELLDTIAAMPGHRGKVVLVTSGEPGIGKSIVARCLNTSAVQRGMLSVLIEVLPEDVFLRAGQRSADASAEGGGALRTNVRSVNLLLDNSQNVAVAAFPGDVRSEFDLIVIDAPALAAQGDVAAISAHADYTLLVARAGTDREAIDRAMVALAQYGNPLTGVVIANDVERIASSA